jgi:hypothetical protein
MSIFVLWHGTQQESTDLVTAIARHCTCEFGLMGVRPFMCPAHRMLMQDQRALDGLLFARRMAHRLLREEFLTTKPVSRSAEAVRARRAAERSTRCLATRACRRA